MAKPEPPPAPPDERWIEYRHPEDLPPDPGNVKGHDGALIWRSIVAHGVIELQTLDERTGRLISGHGRREAFMHGEQDAAAKLAAGEEVSVPSGVRLADDGRWLVPVVRGWASRDDDHARAALVGLNRSVESGGWLPELTDVLEVLDKSPVVDLELAGYDRPYLDKLLSERGELGDRKGAFLDDIAGDDQGKVKGGQGSSEFVQFIITITPETRAELLRQLTEVRRHHKLATNAEAVMAMARDWRPADTGDVR